MADIRQAAKWLKHGKQVRRASWNNASFSLVEVEVGDDYGHLYKRVEPFDEDSIYEPCAADFAAADWELTVEPNAVLCPSVKPGKKNAKVFGCIQPLGHK